MTRLSTRKTLVLALTCVLIAAAATTARAAELVTVPLELAAPTVFLRPGAAVAVPFDAGRSLEGMTAGALTLRGSGHFLRSFCYIFGDYGGGTWFYREDGGLTAALMVGETVLATRALRYAEANYPDEVGVDFETTLELRAQDWSALAGGTGTIVMEGLDCEYYFSYPEVCSCTASASLLEAALVVTVGGGVPATPTAWGSLKARYR
jgi:hypothetical protein